MLSAEKGLKHKLPSLEDLEFTMKLIKKYILYDIKKIYFNCWFGFLGRNYLKAISKLQINVNVYCYDKKKIEREKN